MATQQADAALQQQEGSEQAGMRGKLAPIRLQVDGLQAQVGCQQGTALAAETQGDGGCSHSGLCRAYRQKGGSRGRDGRPSRLQVAGLQAHGIYVT